jgi:hypothetical protein
MSPAMVLLNPKTGRHDIQQNDIQRNDSQLKGLVFDTQHK